MFGNRRPEKREGCPEALFLKVAETGEGGLAEGVEDQPPAHVEEGKAGVLRIAKFSGMRIQLWQERQRREGGRLKGVLSEIVVFQLRQPIIDEAQGGHGIEVFVNCGVLAQVRLGEAEKGGGRFEAIFLQVDEGTGELDEALVEEVVRLAALRKPKFLEHVVGFVEELLIEAREVTEVMGVQTRPVQTSDHGGDAGAFFAHEGSLLAKSDSERLEVEQRATNSS
jgi:hypothetical protein